jgi:hypothetical protein
MRVIISKVSINLGVTEKIHGRSLRVGRAAIGRSSPVRVQYWRAVPRRAEDERVLHESNKTWFRPKKFNSPADFPERGSESLRRRLQRRSQTVLRIDIALPLCLHRIIMRCPPSMRAAVPIAFARISTAISTGAGG